MQQHAGCIVPHRVSFTSLIFSVCAKTTVSLASIFLYTIFKHCTNKTSDYNQGKCQHVWEPPYSLPWSFTLILYFGPLLVLNFTLRFSLFGWRELGTKKNLSLQSELLLAWLKVLPEVLFVVTVAFQSYFFFISVITRTRTGALTHTSFLDVLRPCEWIFPVWPHVSCQARNNSNSPSLPKTVPLCLLAVSGYTEASVFNFTHLALQIFDLCSDELSWGW